MKQLKQIKIIGTNSLLEAAKRLLERGEITSQQYQEMEYRNALLSETQKKDVVILGE